MPGRRWGLNARSQQSTGACADHDDSLARFLSPALNRSERTVAEVEGWIWGSRVRRSVRDPTATARQVPAAHKRNRRHKCNLDRARTGSPGLHDQVEPGELMSRGAGVVQRRIIAALQAEPMRLFTVEELAEIAFPGEPIERKHLVSVLRALKNLPGLDPHLYPAGRVTPVVGATWSDLRDKCCFLCRCLQSRARRTYPMGASPIP